MIQDILPQKLYNTFVRKEPLPDSRILSFRGGTGVLPGAGRRDYVSFLSPGE